MRPAVATFGGIVRLASGCLFCLCMLVPADRARALTYDITPVNLASSGVTFTGTVTTDGSLGPITDSNLVDWSIDVSGPVNFTITPANSALNATVFSMVSASTTEIQVAFPDGNFQFNLLSPFTTTVPSCGNCEEGAVQLFRSDFGRNNQGFFLMDTEDSDPSFDDFQGPVVESTATFYVAATIVPEPGVTVLLGVGLASLGCAARSRSQAPGRTCTAS